MSLKYKVTKEQFEELDEGVQALYHKDGEEYILTVDGAVDATKFKQFRTNNQNLQHTIDDLNKKYGDLDIDEVRALLQTKEDLDEKKLIKEGDLDTLFEKRLKKVVDPLNVQIADLKTASATSLENLSKLTIDNRVVKNAAKLGAHETALDDLCTRARKVFTVNKDGKAVALDADGDPLTDDTGKKVDIDSWLGVQKTKEAPHCFRQSKGGNEKGEHKPAKQQEGEMSSHEKIQAGLKERGYGK